MSNRIIHRVAIAATAVLAMASAAAAQQDVQITNEAITRTCREVHHNPNAAAENPSIGPGGNLVINCRLIGSAGVTIAQVSPAEVCQRITGSAAWHQGSGTQVFCGTAGTASPAPRSFTITQEDIARACQRTHRNPQAAAEPTTVGPYGLELNCRLINQNGVTLARVSPEDVCEAKFGVREWMAVAGSNTFVCKATPTVLGQPDRLPNQPPVDGGGGSGGAAGGAVNDVPLTPEAIAQGCRALHGGNASAVGPVTVVAFEPIIQCNTGGGAVTHKAAEFCPRVSGTPGWYVTDFGRGTWLPGEKPGSAPRLHVCRGPGPLQYHALADIGRYCRNKGHRLANYGIAARRPPACFDAPGAPININIADVCRDVHRASAYAARGMVYLCLPEAAPGKPIAASSP